MLSASPSLLGLLSASLLVGSVLSHQLPLDLTSAVTESVHGHAQLLDESFDQFLAAISAEWGIKGLSVAVVRRQPNGNWHTETKGYGVKNAAGDPVTEDTLFSIGSNSKLLATLSLGTLVESSTNDLKWSTKVASILGDDWKLNDTVAESRANLLDILSHRTGLPRHDLGWHRNQTAADAVRKLRYLRPSVEFREQYQYNNWMYMVAGRIIEETTGLSYLDYVESHIIGRLPFAHATYNFTKALASGHLADGFAQTKRNVSRSSGGLGWAGYAYEPYKFWLDESNQDIIAGAGGCLMSGLDVATWLKTLLLEGQNPITGESVIPANAVRQAAHGISVGLPDPRWPELSVAVYGGGQEQYSYQGHNIVEHNGGWKGWLTVISRSPADGLGIAVLTNWDEGAYVMDIVKYYLYEKALGLPHVNWSARIRARLESQLAADSAKPLQGSLTPSSSLSVKSFVGAYSNPAYGRFDICPPPSSTSATSPLHHSSACAASDLFWAQVASVNATIGTPQLAGTITPTPAVGNFLTLQYVSDNKFIGDLYEVTTSPPKEGEEDRVVVLPQWDRSATLEFVVNGKSGKVEGFGLTQVWGAGEGVRSPTGKSIKERAEVWFDRLN